MHVVFPVSGDHLICACPFCLPTGGSSILAKASRLHQQLLFPFKGLLYCRSQYVPMAAPEGVSSTKSSPSRSVMNGTSRFTTYSGSSPPQKLYPAANGIHAVRQTHQLASSLLRPEKMPYQHLRQPTSLPPSPARVPHNSALPSSAPNPPVSIPQGATSAQQMSQVSRQDMPSRPGQDLGSTRMGVVPQDARKGVGSSARLISQGSEAAPRKQHWANQAGGWNPLSSNSASIIDWSRNSGSLHNSLDSAALTSAGPDVLKQSQGHGVAMPGPHLLHAAFQNLSLQPKPELDSLRGGPLSSSFLPLTPSRNSSADNLSSMKPVQPGEPSNIPKQ